MNTRTIQELTDAFNKAYYKASVTAKPDDWLETSLAGRHLVNGLVKRGFATDLLPELQKAEIYPK